MRKRKCVNLADRAASMELLKQLYGNQEVMDDCGVKEGGVQVENAGAKRGCVATGVGEVDEVEKVAGDTYS